MNDIIDSVSRARGVAIKDSPQSDTSSKNAQPEPQDAKADTVHLTAEAEQLAKMGKEIASEGPSVDTAKVEAIRQALAKGEYAVNPEKIAEKFMALEQQLGKL